MDKQRYKRRCHAIHMRIRACFVDKRRSPLRRNNIILWIWRRILNKTGRERIITKSIWTILSPLIQTWQMREWMSGAGFIVCEKGLLLIDRPIKTSLASKLCAMLWSKQCQFSRELDKSPVRMHWKEILAPQKWTSNSIKKHSQREINVLCSVKIYEWKFR